MKFLAASLGLAALAAASPALAQDCKPPVLATSVNLVPTDDGRVLVPVQIDGQDRHFLLGTAAGLTTFTNNSADALHLHATQQGRRALDANGYASREYVHIDSLQLGNLKAERLTLMLTPDPKAGIAPAYDGVLAYDAMDRYDVEMDFAAGKLNYFSQDHCPGQVVYWDAPAGTIVPIAVRQRLDNRARKGDVVQNIAAPTGDVDTDDFLSDLTDKTGSPVAGSDIRAHVMLDGKDFTANIDTSLPYSTLNTVAARVVFDITADSPGSAPVDSLLENNPDAKPNAATETITVYGTHSFEHTFHTLALGGVTVANPHFLVRPDLTGQHDPDNTAVLGTRVYTADQDVLPDISIGMDVLRKLHLYFAFREHKLYITAAGPQQSASTAP